MTDGMMTRNQVVVFHDETKDVSGQGLKGHVLYFVPLRLTVASSTPLFGTELHECSPQTLLCNWIADLRSRYACEGKLHFARLSGKKWTKYDYAYRGAVDAAVDSLRSKSPQVFTYPLHCKLAVMFYAKGADWSIYGGKSRKEQKLRHDETILRMLLKGAAHYLYDERNLVEIVRIVSDGDPNHRRLDENRVLWRLAVDDLYGRSPLRDYVSLADSACVAHLPSDHKQYAAESAEFRHANLLQVADLLLGSVMHACYKGSSSSGALPRIGDPCEKRAIIAQPVVEMLEKKKRGPGFRHSGHYRAFTISEVFFARDGVTFREVEPEQVVDSDAAALQQQFDFETDIDKST